MGGTARNKLEKARKNTGQRLDRKERHMVKALAAVTREAGKFSIEEVDLAAPKAGEVLVRNVGCGVCHTDVFGLSMPRTPDNPAVLGHEGVGVVEEVGVGVDSLEVGDRVVMSFPSCGTCPNCTEGLPYACEHLNEMFFGGVYKDGTKRFSKDGTDISSWFGQGSFSSHVIVAARSAVKVDVDSDEDLLKLCGFGCGIQTGAGVVMNAIKSTPGTSFVVFGLGGVGMGAIMAAKIVGCNPIIGVARRPERLALAKELGATHVLNNNEVDVAEEVKKITGGGAHGCIETSGSHELLVTALKCLRRLGKVCTVAVTGNAEIPIPVGPLIMNPSTALMGATEGASNPQIFIPELVDFFKRGLLPVEKFLVYYDFKDIAQAFEDQHAGKVIKPVLKF
jgi:aryl-alcohol dehydrogenase